MKDSIHLVSPLLQKGIVHSFLRHSFLKNGESNVYPYYQSLNANFFFKNNIEFQVFKVNRLLLARALKIISKSIVMKVVKTFIIGAVTVLCISSAVGQTAYGLKGGVNIADRSGDLYASRVSGHGGFFANVSITKNFFIQPELLYSGEGFEFWSTNVKHKWVLNYIQFPVMLQYYPISHVYVETGPQVGFLISAKDKIEESSQDGKDYINSVQFAIGAGLGIKATDNIIVYGRYNFGLSDITSPHADLVDVHSNVGQIGIAVRFRK